MKNGKYRSIATTDIAVCLFILLASVISGCGSSDDGDITPITGSGNWTAGVFQPAANFEDRCLSPRSGIDPETGQAYEDRQGTTLDENNWLRSWSNNTYLWYDEITDRNPAGYATPAYFELLKTDAVTPSGNPKDKFHFTYTTEEWRQLSQSGVSAGYGAQWVIIAGAPPRDVRVAYTEPNSPATDAGLARGAEILTVDGVDVVNGNDIDTLNAALFPADAGETHNFIVRDSGAVVTRSISMTSADVTSDPVQYVQTLAGGEVGYMLFNDHIATAEAELFDAIEWLEIQGITDLVLDIRYNGGGYLAIASQLAYMIAGNNIPAADEIFESMTFNDKHPITNPVTGQPLTPMPFIDFTIGLSANPAGQPLPTLDLNRIFVLTGPNSCSASESIMNGLRGVGVEVIQIGSTTCGKPYGFYPEDNCGTTYFTIQFRGENALGFGDYTDGFSPANTTSNTGTVIPGCSVADDFSEQLGNPAENRLAAALAYRQNPGTCPAATGNTRWIISSDGTTTVPLSAADGYTPKSPWLQNRIIDWWKQ